MLTLTNKTIFDQAKESQKLFLVLYLYLVGILSNNEIESITQIDSCFVTSVSLVWRRAGSVGGECQSASPAHSTSMAVSTGPATATVRQTGLDIFIKEDFRFLVPPNFKIII